MAACLSGQHYPLLNSLILCGRSLCAVLSWGTCAGSSVGFTGCPWPDSRWCSLGGNILLYHGTHSFVGQLDGLNPALFFGVCQSHVKALYPCSSKEWPCSLPSALPTFLPSYQYPSFAPPSTLSRIRCCVCHTMICQLSNGSRSLILNRAVVVGSMGMALLEF